MEKNLINILNFFEKLLKWKKLLIINFLIIAIVSLLFSFIVPRWYKSTSVLLGPEGDMVGLNIASMISDALPIGGMLGGGVSEEATRFLSIINSRTMMEDVATKFDLQKRYKAKNIELTVKTLRKRIKADINEDGTVTVTTLTKTPFFIFKGKDDEARFLAQNMTRYIISRLDEYNIKLKGEKATDFRKFIETRYLQNLKDLEIAEEKLKEFQNETGIISLEDQMLATINVASQLKGQLIAKEIELGILKNYFGDTNVEYKRVKNELDEYEKRYDLFKKGNKDLVFNEDSKDLLLTINDIPEKGVQYLRLLRDVKLQETILEFILPQYEQAKIQEQKEIPTLQILDDANYPIKKAKPKRAFLILFVVFFGMVLSVIFVLMIEQVNEYKENDSQAYAKLLKIKKMIK